MRTTTVLLAFSGLVATAPSGPHGDRRLGYHNSNSNSTKYDTSRTWKGYRESMTAPSGYPRGTGYIASSGFAPTGGLAPGAAHTQSAVPTLAMSQDASSNVGSGPDATSPEYGTGPVVAEQVDPVVGKSTLTSMMTVPYPASTAPAYGVAAVSSITRTKCRGGKHTSSKATSVSTQAPVIPAQTSASNTIETPTALSSTSSTLVVEYGVSSYLPTPFSATVPTQQPEASSYASVASSSAATAAPQASSPAATPGQTSLGDSKTDGKATFYGGNLSGGTCSFTEYTIPSGLFGVAYPTPDWDNSGNCGACLEVTGPNGNTLTVMVVDSCPSCEAGHLDLFSDAFLQFADASAGEIGVSYKFVTCGITSPIVLHNKSGVSAYWFSMQVVNSNEPVKSLEVSVDGGATWEATKRQDYNFFEKNTGFGTAKVDVRVTSETGKTLIVKDVSIESDSRKTCDSNF
ncbi:Expansin-like protein 6 [Ceratocystis lukuohia]|uniref:Expansin-like protein 6 n=1 Tax=Ceratocystis lukuohia TaxID=2019550 RepID=A0ABR4MIF8_9PEZI